MALSDDDRRRLERKRELLLRKKRMLESGEAENETSAEADEVRTASRTNTGLGSRLRTIARDVGGAAANVAQGFFLGGADELFGATTALAFPQGRFRDSVDSNKELFREAERDFAERRPVTAFGAQLGGALAGPGKIAAVGSAGRAAPALTRLGLGPGLARGAGRVAAGVGVGAGTGAAAGALGTDGGLAERAEGAAIGGALGGALGGTFSGAVPILRFAGNFARKVTGNMSTTETERRAARVIHKRLQDSGFSPEQAHAFFKQLDDAGVSGATLADLDENFVGLAQMVARQPGGGQNTARALYEQRIGEQGARTVKQIAKRISNKDAQEAFETITMRQKANAQPLYDAAYAQSLKADPALDELFKRPTMRTALQAAQRRALDDGIDPGDLGIEVVGGKVILGPGASTRVVDYVKRDLDDKISVALRRGAKDRARTLMDMRRQLLDIVDGQNPDFQAARQAFAGEAGNLEALEFGVSALKGNKTAADIQAEVAQYTAGQKELFKAGLVRSIRDVMDQTRDNSNVIRRFFSTPAKRDIIRLAFDNDEDFARFAEAMRFEAKLVENAQRINPAAGSQTQRLQAELADSGNVVEEILDPSQSVQEGLLSRSVRGLARAGQDASNRQVQGALANSLFQPGSQAIDEATERMAQDLLARRMAQRGLFGLGGAATIGTQSGLASNSN